MPTNKGSKIVKTFINSSVATIGAGMIGYSFEGITGTLFCSGVAMIISVIVASMYD